MTYKRPESVLVVIWAKGQVLMCQRRDVPSFWQSVTGSLQPGESPLAAAKRELAEETGLTEADGDLVDCQVQNQFTIYPHWQHRYAPGTKTNCEYVFSFELPSCLAITLSQEHLQYCWLDRDKAIATASSPSNQQAIIDWVK